MGYSDIIAREAESLPPEKQAEILDFIFFLKSRQFLTVTSNPKTAGEVEQFFRNFKVDIKDYKFHPRSHAPHPQFKGLR